MFKDGNNRHEVYLIPFNYNKVSVQSVFNNGTEYSSVILLRRQREKSESYVACTYQHFHDALLSILDDCCRMSFLLREIFIYYAYLGKTLIYHNSYTC